MPSPVPLPPLSLSSSPTHSQVWAAVRTPLVSRVLCLKRRSTAAAFAITMPPTSAFSVLLPCASLTRWLSKGPLQCLRRCDYNLCLPFFFVCVCVWGVGVGLSAPPSTPPHLAPRASFMLFPSPLSAGFVLSPVVVAPILDSACLPAWPPLVSPPPVPPKIHRVLITAAISLLLCAWWDDVCG